MEPSEIRENLTLKKVELEHLDQFNELLRYVFQVTDSDIEESGYSDDDDIARAKGPVLREAEVFGWFNGENLISQLAIYPCQVNIHNTIYNMGGLTGVGTYPEYAGLGLMQDLIHLALKAMRAEKQWISYLFPYNIPYYRRKGWEVISDQMTYEIKDTQLPAVQPTDGFVERLDIDDPDVIKLYNQFAEKTHGAMIRNQLNWEEYWRWENEEERTAAVYYNEDKEPTGFCFYWIADEIFHVKEMIYLNQEAREALWGFISAHFSMVETVKGTTFTNEPISFLFEDSDIKETIQPYYMARIVDVEEFLKQYPFETTCTPFHFIVSDPHAEWNDRLFGLSWNDNGMLQISDAPIGKPVKLSIQTLTAMLMSYKRPSYLYRIERIEADSKTIKQLDDIIPSQNAYFSDYF